MTTETMNCGEATAVSNAFGQLITCVSRAALERSVSPVFSEAKRLEDAYRARFAENDAVMKAVFVVLESGNPEIENFPTVTKDGLADALASAFVARVEDLRYSKLFVASATYVLNNWNSLCLGPYKNVDGTINWASARAGREQMVLEQEAIVRQILSIEVNAQTLAKAQLAVALEPEVVEEVVVTITVKDAIVKQSQARPGEGPYQVAARVLGSDGKMIDEEQVKALSQAFMQDYDQQRRNNIQLQEHLGVEVGHAFLTSDNVSAVLENISDSGLKERLIKIAGQDAAYRPPVISPIPPRSAGSVPAAAALQAGSFYNHVFFTR